MASQQKQPSDHLTEEDASIGSCDYEADCDEKGECGACPALEATETERDTLAHKENRIVMFMKLVVVVVLILTSFFVSSMVYKYIRDDQIANFKAAFDADATKLVEAFHQKIQNQIEALDALSVAITSHALVANATFPFFTMPNLAASFANARVMSGSFMVSYNPLVTNANREQWETYFMDNIQHFDVALKDDLKLQSIQNAKYHTTHHEDDGSYVPGKDINTKIVLPNATGGFDLAPVGSGPFLPMYHMSPVPVTAGALNLDIGRHPTFATAIQQSMQSGMAVLGDAQLLVGPQLDRTAGYFNMLLARSQFRNDMAAYEGDPMSSFIYPVFNTLDVETRQPVGGLGSVLYWRLLFKGVLPDKEYKRGIIAVLTNTFGQTLSYRIDNAVTFLGHGDLHDAKYDDMSRNCTTSKSDEVAMERKSLTSVALDEEHNSYTLFVYPSQDTENEYVNCDALNATFVVQGVFAITSFVFILYTLAVGRRQRVVMDRAVASGAIVSSLFPSQVRDQLYEENEAKKIPPKTTAALPNYRRKDSSSTDGLSDSSTMAASPAHNRPIASVFDQTTILFADMVGFTKWSSTREPVKVFELLETLYQAFDAIAVRRRVFKVETIGDCYVAVAGLPDPQENHAVIMVKFADACMAKMKELTAELVDSLGPDTADLTMRVGLHSGSVTGGVLRGQKSRFQLFGDTMNTASRMESNGMPGRIHVSQETADELVAKGKSAWISPREDKIVAKGKGELQTFWVNPRSSASSSTSSESGGASAEGTVATTATTTTTSDANVREHPTTTFTI